MKEAKRSERDDNSSDVDHDILKNEPFAYLCHRDNGLEQILTASELKWKFKMNEFFFYIILYVIHFLGNMFYHFTKQSIFPPPHERYCSAECSIGRTDSICKVHTNASRLVAWFEKDMCPFFRSDENVLSIPHDELSRYIAFASFQKAHLRVAAALCKEALHKDVDFSGVRSKMLDLLSTVNKHQRLKPISYRLSTFLHEIVASSDEQIRELLSHLVVMAQNVSIDFVVRECHGGTILSRKDKTNAEAVLAICSVLITGNIHITTFYLTLQFMKQDYFLSGMLNLLNWFMVCYCGIDEYDLSNYKGMLGYSRSCAATVCRSVFLSEKTFEPVFSDFGGRDVHSYAQALQWDFAINFCEEMMESDWSVEMMERAAWAHSSGKPYISKDLFETLQKNRLTPKVNYTFYNVKSLLALSVSGLIKFTGFDTCLFNLTGNDEALFIVHGYLGKPTLQDLLDLKLVRMKKGGWFQIADLPGCTSKHKGVQISDRILIVRSKENTPFRGCAEQKVG